MCWEASALDFEERLLDAGGGPGGGGAIDVLGAHTLHYFIHIQENQPYEANLFHFR
jgi:hypothetical protein